MTEAAPSFAHLHVKSQFTLLGALGTPKEYVKHCASLGMKHLALTDEMNLFGAVEFFQACKDNDIRPVIGCELIVAPQSRLEKNKVRDNHRLVALIRNEAGYVALNHLVTEGYLSGRHFVPRIDKDLLTEQGPGIREGLVLLSGDLRGEIPRLLARDKFEEAEAAARWYADLAGEGNFFLELMDLGWGSVPGNTGEADQVVINQRLRDLSAKTGIPTIVSNNVHYPSQERSFHHEVLQCLGMTNTLQDEFRFRFPTDQFFLKTPEQMAALFPEDDDARARTVEVAERCDFAFEYGNYRFPVYPHLQGRTEHEALCELAETGLNERLVVVKRKNDEAGVTTPWDEVEATYRDRMKVELQIIEQMGFSAYFLIVYDFIAWAKKNDIPVGPGRGSGAGSLTLYALRITDIDPLPYALLFERFLNPERVSMPDIDVDFCQDRRGEVIDYVGDAYGGATRVTQIITYGKMLAKGVLKDTGRVMGLQFSDTDRITKLIPDVLGITLDKAWEMEPRIAELCAAEPVFGRLWNLAKGLEGTVRHCSVHAAGVVIADDDLRKYCPLYKGAGDSDPSVTMFDMGYAEKIGLIKFDFLGLKTVTQVKNALDMARAAGKTKWDFFSFNDVPLDDPAVYRLLTRGDTLGVFQLESSGMRELLRNLKPSRFEDIIAVAALYRPGPMGLGMHHVFVECKHGRSEVTYPHKMLKEILEPTYGVIVFQEQVMQIAQRMGGYSLGQADMLRRAMGKKKQSEMDKHRVIFTEGATAQGVDEGKATEVFNLMAEFAKYGFNKSHTAAYGLIAYQTAWIKHHLPAEFFAALLTIESSNTDKVLLYIDDAKNHGVKILPPDVNESGLGFAVVDENVRFGLTAIKGLGEGAIESILEARREKGRFATIEEFLEGLELGKVNKGALEALIKCGAFDSMGYTRRALLESLDRLVEYAKRQAQDRNSGQVGLFAALGGGGAGRLNIAQVPEFPERIRLAKEKEALGFYITGHPMSAFQSEVERWSTARTADLAELRPDSEVKLCGIVSSMKVVVTKKSGKRMAFVQFEDTVGSVECIVFPKTFEVAEAFLSTEQPLLLTAKIDPKGGDDGVKLLAEEVLSLAAVRQEQTRQVRFQFKAAEGNKATLGKLKRLIGEYSGEIPVGVDYVLPDGTEVAMKLPPEWTVRPTQEMVEAAEAAFERRVTVFR